MTKTELRRRALRAAAAVTFTFGVSACGGAVDYAEEDQDGVADPADPVEQEDVAASPPVKTPTPREEEDPGHVADGQAPGLGDLEPGVMCVDGITEAEMQAYYECCNANGWNWDLGCMAWGPPVPPEMSARRRAA